MFRSYIKNKGRKRKRLYAAFQEEIKKEKRENAIGRGEADVSIDTPIVKESTKTAVIAVCGITEKIGCTHISDIFQQYFKSHYKKSYIIDEGLGYKLDCIAGTVDYIILDGWPVDHINVRNADIKILVTNLSETNINRLAVHIKSSINAVSWVYLFNSVRKGDKRKAWGLMEGYRYQCLPVFLKMDRNIEKCIKRCLRMNK